MSPTAEALPFPVIDFAKLIPDESRGINLNEAVEERKRLWEAATGIGFWYLKSHPVYAPSLLPSATPISSSSTIPYSIPSNPASSSPTSAAIPTPPEILTKLGTSFFELPTEEKMKCWQGNSGGSRGYKPIGSTTVSLRTPGGIKDQCEMLNVGVGDVGLGTLGTAGEGAGGFEFPDVVKGQIGSVIEPFIRAHAVANEVVLAVLEEGLVRHLGVGDNGQDVKNGHAVLNAHKLPSGRKNLSEMRIVKSPEDTSSQAQAQAEGDDGEAVIAVGAHTDFGSLSCVHNFQPGLQVLLPTSAEGEKVEWQDIPPLPGHAICNVGDALHLLSGGVLKSAMHRVVVPKVHGQANGEKNGHANGNGNGHLDAAKARGTRYSVVYFTRPHDDVLLRAVYGNGSTQDEEAVTAGEWFRRRQSKWRSKDHKEAWEQSRGTEHVRYAS